MLFRHALTWRALTRKSILLPKPRYSSQAPNAVNVNRLPSSRISRVDRRTHQNPPFELADQAQNYQYKPLDPGNNEIRLLWLRYNPHEAIYCELIHTPIDVAPPYHALSYAWGDKFADQSIYITSAGANVGTFLVTQNLHDAVQRLKPKGPLEELILWADAICINQLDIPERNAQTGKMRTIYEKAAKLCVWIGQEYSGSRDAIELAHDLNRCPREDIADMLQQPSKAEATKSIVDLFRRPYWWRIWVVQEISCGVDQNTIIYCGQDSISWADLENVCDIMQGIEEMLRSDLLYKHNSMVRTLTHGGPRGLMRTRHSHVASNPHLLDLLLSHKSKQSTDPKDKVYALVGISSSRESFGPLDYSLSIREVYSRTARHIINSSRKLDVICVNNDGYQYDLPTWVPDWTRKRRAVIGLHHHTPPFLAAKGSMARFSFLDDGSILKAHGVLIDRIKITGVPYPRDLAPTDILPALGAYNHWRHMFVQHKGQSPSLDAEFGKVISAGNWQFENTKIYSERLRLLSTLSDQQLVQYSTGGTPTRALEKADEVPLGKYQVENNEKEAIQVALSASIMMSKRTFFISDTNITGLVPYNAQSGDIICVLLGCRTPVVLREKAEGFILVGEAYVSGLMSGEAMDCLQDGSLELDAFEIH